MTAFLTRCKEVMWVVCVDFDAELREFNAATCEGGHVWSRSYFAGSCGGAPLAVVKEYIENHNCPAR